MPKFSKGDAMFKDNLTTLLSTAKLVLKMGLALAIMLICSCNSNDLSRQKAAELISKQQKLPVTQTFVLGSYFKSSRSDPASGPFGMTAACLVSGGGEDYSEVKQVLTELQSKGLITVGERTDKNGECNYIYATTTLTDEGKKYLVKESDGTHEVKIYDLAFGEVTGIQINEQLKIAEADYTLKIINITPFGKNISTVPIYRKATFALFDDGWRIK